MKIIQKPSELFEPAAQQVENQNVTQFKKNIGFTKLSTLLREMQHIACYRYNATIIILLLKREENPIWRTGYL